MEADVEIGYFVIIDHLYPERVHIRRGATIAMQSTILAHDEARRYARDGIEEIRDTTIGRNAFVGVHAVVLPGVTVGDEAIVGAGSIVTKDVRSGAMVAGNPAHEITRDG